MQSILIQDVCYEFEPVTFSQGQKKINKVISKENLFILHSVLFPTRVHWGLIYGTLLGAIRENDFIEHDKDTDIYVLDEDRDLFLQCIPTLLSCGFIIARYSDFLLSLIRRDEYIDFYFFKKTYRGRQAGQYVVPRLYFNSSDKISFLGLVFPTVFRPHDFLRHVYGVDWHIPIADKHAQPSLDRFSKFRLSFLKSKLANKFPSLYSFLKSIANNP